MEKQRATGEHGEELVNQLTQEKIVERQLFLNQLWATDEQLVKNTQHNTEKSASYYFVRFCEVTDIRTISQQNKIIATLFRLLNDYFHKLSLQCQGQKEQNTHLSASVISNDDISNECSRIHRVFDEYKYLLNEWIKLLELLNENGIPRFWENEPWSTNIYTNLAENYNELVAQMRDLFNATPRRFRGLLPRDDELKRFPYRINQ